MKKSDISVIIPMLHQHLFQYHAYCQYRIHYLNLGSTMQEAEIVSKYLFMRKLKNCRAYAGMFVWDVSMYGGGLDSAIEKINRKNGYGEVMDLLRTKIGKASEEYCLLAVHSVWIKIPKTEERYYTDLGFIVKNLYE